MFDAAVIGSGPAGLSAAINLKQLGKEIIWFGSPDMSAKVERSELIANYPGFGMITGKELNDAFKKHAEELELTLTDAMVTTITYSNAGYMLLADNQVYQAKTVIFAIGAVTAKGYPGENEFLGRGVSYCATCDGFFYKKKTIAVCCFDKRYEHEIEYLANIVERIYLFTTYKDSTIDLPNIERLSSPVTEIEGGERVERIRLADNEMVDVNGVFIFRNAVAPATLLPGLEMDGPHIVVDRNMASNIAGCYACGDCTGRPYQIAKAIGEGNIAAHSAAAL